MRRRSASFGFLAVLGVCIVSTGASAQLFSIVSPRYSGGVDPDNYRAGPPVIEPGGEISRSEFRGGLIYFSFGVELSDAALARLAARGRLRVRCMVYANGYRDDEIEVGITPITWGAQGAAITNAVRDNGTFVWRTYMYTRKIDAESISILVKDELGVVAKPIGFSGSYNAKLTIKP